MRILNKKSWPVQIRIKHHDFVKQLDWCQEQFGADNVRFTSHHACFKNNNDAVFFTLRWH